MHGKSHPRAQCQSTELEHLLSQIIYSPPVIAYIGADFTSFRERHQDEIHKAAENGINLPAIWDCPDLSAPCHSSSGHARSQSLDDTGVKSYVEKQFYGDKVRHGPDLLKSYHTAGEPILSAE
jgi:hypothetical protein